MERFECEEVAQPTYFVLSPGTRGQRAPYLQEQADVTLWSWMRRASDRQNQAKDRENRTMGNQAAAYNQFVPQISAEWLAIWDLDEFVFGANTTVAEFLHTLHPTTAKQVCLPWLVFGSGGAVKHPSCVTAAN